VLRTAGFSLLFVLAFGASACGGANADDNPPVVIRTPTSIVASPDATGTATGTSPGGDTPTPADAATPTLPAGSASATPAVTPDNAIVVACGDILAPLDKQHRLPADCVPSGLVALPDSYTFGGGQYLVSEAANAMIELVDAAANDGVFISVISSYRSYEHQVGTYNWHVATYGEEQASRVSARPGHSEHQLGTTADVVSASAGYVLENFPGTPEAAWVEANASRFGFVVSYPDGLEPVTGYAYEPWHIRYVGDQTAASVAASGLTLGQYLLAR